LANVRFAPGAAVRWTLAGIESDGQRSYHRGGSSRGQSHPLASAAEPVRRRRSAGQMRPAAARLTSASGRGCLALLRRVSRRASRRPKDCWVRPARRPFIGRRLTLSSAKRHSRSERQSSRWLRTTAAAFAVSPVPDRGQARACSLFPCLQLYTVPGKFN
jgi:hypothetical protein